MVSRTVRVGLVLALFAWTLSGVPERVQAQRNAVASLAAERGAASAGGAVLARIADLRGAQAEPGVWRYSPAEACAPTRAAKIGRAHV